MRCCWFFRYVSISAYFSRTTWPRGGGNARNCSRNLAPPWCFSWWHHCLAKDCPAASWPERRRRLGFLRRRVVHHGHVGHAAVGLGSAGPLLRHAGGVDTDVGHAPPVLVVPPRPHDLVAEGVPGVEAVADAAAGILSSPLEGRFAQGQACRLRQPPGRRLG